MHCGWVLILAQLLLLCVLLPPMAVMAIVHVVDGPLAADLPDHHLCTNIVLSLAGWVPGGCRLFR